MSSSDPFSPPGFDIVALNNKVKPHVGTKWYDLGLQLLGSKHEGALETVRGNFSGDNCCREMLQLWLRTAPNANWEQLLVSLEAPGVGLSKLAMQLKKELPVTPENTRTLLREEQEHSAMHQQYSETRHQLNEARYKLQEQNELLKRKELEHSDMYQQLTQSNYQLDEAKKELNTKIETMTRMASSSTSSWNFWGGMVEFPTGKETYVRMKNHYKQILEENAVLRNELHEKEKIIKRFGMESAQRLQATGQAAKIDDDNPIEAAKLTLYDLWEIYYRPACRDMEAAAKQEREKIVQKIGSIKKPEDYLDIIMTEALQKSFDYSVDIIKKILYNAMKKGPPYSSEDHWRFMQMLAEEAQGTKDYLIGLHYKDTLGAREKENKETPIYKKWMAFAQKEILLITTEKIMEVQGAVKEVFLQAIVNGMKYIKADFEIRDNPAFSKAAEFTAEVVWTMITLSFPILLKSSTIDDAKRSSLKYNKEEMIVHPGSKAKGNLVKAFAEPTVIDSRNGGIIIRGYVFC